MTIDSVPLYRFMHNVHILPQILLKIVIFKQEDRLCMSIHLHVFRVRYALLL